MTTSPMTALKIAANLDDRDKIRELLALAVETGDAALERTLRSRAQSLGITAAPGKTGALAKRIQADFEALLKAQAIKVRSYADDLASGGVTQDYVLEKTNHPRFKAEIESLIGDATRNLDDAEASFTAAYRALAAITSSNDANQALLAETRATKIWSRLERKLNTTREYLVVLESALREAAIGGEEQRLTLAVILTEAPSFLDAAGVPNAEDLVREAALKSSPTLIALNEQKTAAAKLLALVRHNASIITQATSANVRDIPADTSRVSGYLGLDLSA